MFTQEQLDNYLQSERNKTVQKSKQWTLGQLIDALSHIDKNKKVKFKFDDGNRGFKKNNFRFN